MFFNHYMILMKGSMVSKEALFSLRVIGIYIHFLNIKANEIKKYYKMIYILLLTYTK